ncbi:ferric reductase-like transmembrane domain-containing protein [Acidiferrimicrobium sp. IK]|uniref:ferredoxin reductase family protein n=1 Tax=Acidiferrimicrobium sp. IK TaxID=2871700 RepID=UPI0021CB56FB|nr:ferredoxin reductase family protein [Acidiferrimicrobium sp. IK]MCU4186820.1 ferric reductase-like transmembrane domain-containing protein [Acidiferrimicrobium sp. IK]
MSLHTLDAAAGDVAAPAAGAPASGAPTRRRHRPRRWVPDVAAVATGLGLGASVAWPISQTTGAALRSPGGVATVLGDATAMAGTYLLLIMVLLAARLPALEAALGQDRLIRWHRRTSSAPLLLLGAHGVLTTLGYAQAGRLGFWNEAGSLITTMGWIFASVVAYAMIVGIAGISIRAVRRRVDYDTWWVIHLYTYLALAFSVPHQIFDGTTLVGHPLAKGAWIVLWLSTAGVVVAFRIGMPVVRTLRHQLHVVDIRPEGADVWSLVVRGRHLERLAVAGGQYFAWRFLTTGLWWHAHPFSLSAMPSPPYLRVTIKVTGDATAQISRLRPGTRIAIEGPYGAFTDHARTRAKVALVGAGVGITPLRALLEDLPPDVDVVVVQRASDERELIHHSEIEAMVAARRGRMVTLAGSRRRHRLDDPAHLRRAVPDLSGRDLFVCGPDDFSAGVVAAATALGVPRRAIHCESFAS